MSGEAQPGDSSPRTLRVAVVPVSDVGDDLHAAWRELAADAAEPNPFFAPELLLPAARWLPGGGDISLLTVWRGRRLVLAMPVARTRYRRVPLPAVSTWKHPYCYLGTPLILADELDSAPAAALGALQRNGPGWLVLEQVYVEGPVALAFRRAAAEAGATWVEQGVWERPSVEASEHGTNDESMLSPRSAKTLRRLRRNLERDVGDVSSADRVRFAEAAVVDAEIESFLDMELASWKGRAGTAIANTESHAAFFRETCRGFARDGRLAMWQLRAGAVDAARECHLRAGDTIFGWKTAFNDELARFSPGVQLEIDVLHAFYDDPAHRMDPCTADQPSTSGRLYPQRRAVGDVLVGFSLPGRLVTRLLPRAARVWERARSVRRRQAGRPGAARPADSTPGG
jgi:CelD/BcsL family acetyltransferase involved in cellulose biosynthesis